MTTLQQGPALMPRNWLADRLREYGLAGLLGAGGAVNNLLGSYGYDSPGQLQQPADWTRNLRPGDI